MFQIYKLLILLAFLSAALCINAQQLVGIVVDNDTKETLDFVNVFYKSDPSTGVVTNERGKFRLPYKPNADSVVISFLGYKTKTLPVAYFDSKAQVGLEWDAFTFEAVEILAGEDPKDVFMRTVFRSKKKNNADKHNEYYREVYKKVEYGLSDVNQKLKDRNLVKKFDFITSNIDSSNYDEPYIPLYMKESIADQYFSKERKIETEIVRAINYSGFETEVLSQALQTKIAHAKIYDNHVDLLDQDFISPISDFGLIHYDYDFVDTIPTDRGAVMKINFTPKHASSKLFEGTMFIDSMSRAVAKIKLKPSEWINVNFVEDFVIKQDFKQINDTTWIITQNNVAIKMMDLTDPISAQFSKKMRDRAPNIIAVENTSYDNYEFALSESHLKQADTTNLNVAAEELIVKDDSFWDASRHDTLSKEQKMVFTYVDSIKNSPEIKRITTIFQTVFTGRYRIGKVSVGNIYSLYRNNEIEGSRVAASLMTTQKLSKRYRLYGFLAYGFGDKRFKYELRGEYVLKRVPWHKINLSYVDEVDWVKVKNTLENRNGLLDEVNTQSRRFQRKWLARKELELRTEHQLSKNWNANFKGRVSEIDPYFEFDYFNPDINNDTIRVVNNTELAFGLQYAFEQDYLNGALNRIALGSRYPTPSVEYAVGINNQPFGDYTYHKLTFNLFYKWKLGIIGTSKINYNTGKIFGELPYLLLTIPSGNESWILNKRGFNLIRNFEFIFDQHHIVTWSHHFEGFFFNKIPLIEKMKLRSVISARAAYGTLSASNFEANKAAFIENTGTDDIVRIRQLGNVPYVEFGAGIENIFQFLRFELVWRATHRAERKRNNIGFFVGMDIQL